VTARRVLLVAAILGASGVALGAFGAHALKSRLSAADLAVFETGVRYQMYHAMALAGIAGWSERHPTAALWWSARLMSIGTVIFSVSLYLLSVGGIRWLGAVTPFGGLSLIAGWVALALAALRYDVKTIR
jgi:uncharacterized membrane protein YgdD (TMEM256/DUF423 family)